MSDHLTPPGGLTSEGGAEDTADFASPQRAPDRTVELHTGVTEPPPGLWLVFLLVAAAALLAGIGVAAATRPHAAGTLVASATVGRDGATLAFGGKGRLRIPDGALARPTQITVRRSTVPERLRVQPPAGPFYVFERGQLIAYTFAPSSLTFLRPVTIVLPLDRTGRNGTAFVVAGRTVLFLGGKADTHAGTVTLSVFDFRFQGGLAPGEPS